MPERVGVPRGRGGHTLVPATFGQPVLLWTLLVVPLALGCYVAFERRRRSVAGRFASTQMQPNVVERPARRRRHVPTACYAVALAALGVATARPYAEAVERSPSTTVVLAIDTSDSMRATDEPPTRLWGRSERRRRIPGGRSLPMCARASWGSPTTPRSTIPPTVDRQATLQALQSMRTRSGTAIGDGMAAALRQVAGAGGKGVIVLLSDGANNAGVVDPVRAAQEAAAAWVAVSTVAIGFVPAAGGWLQRPRARRQREAAGQDRAAERGFRLLGDLGLASCRTSIAGSAAPSPSIAISWRSPGCSSWPGRRWRRWVPRWRASGSAGSPDAG